MSKRNKRIYRRPESNPGQSVAQVPRPDDAATPRQWGTVTMVLLSLGSVVFGIFIGVGIRSESPPPAPARATATAPTFAPSTTTIMGSGMPTDSTQLDAYGRPPGDPHYGHDHPPADPAPGTATTTIMGSGVPADGTQLDAYGRPPGDPHYGHDHP